MSSLGLFVSDFFQRAPVPPPHSSHQLGMHHVRDYLDTTQGVWDFSRVMELVCSFAKEIPFLSSAQSRYMGSARDVFALTGSALSVPQFVRDAYTVNENFQKLFAQTAHPGRVTKKFLVSVSDLGFTTSQALTFFHDSKLADVGKHLSTISFVANVTSLFSDGMECIEHLCGMGDRRDDPTLTLMNLIKCVASIALSIIGLCVLGGALTMSSPLVFATVLSLTVAWLAMKISTHFYEAVN